MLLIWLLSSFLFFFIYRYIYIFPFSLFTSVYVYAALCDFVCIALLLPFVLGFCLSRFVLFWFFCFFRIVFSACYHWWICFLVWLLSSFFLSFLNYFIFTFNNLFFILITLFYFIYLLIYFCLPFLLSCVADSVLMLQPGVRPELLRWESQVQDIGPPETSRLHVISNCESSPRDLHLNAKTQLHSTTSKLQCWTPYAKQPARQEHNPTH